MFVELILNITTNETIIITNKYTSVEIVVKVHRLYRFNKYECSCK